MEIRWTAQASEDFDYWLAHDPKIAVRIRALIENIQATPFIGIGQPEPLKHQLSGWWSRRITREHRLVYRVTRTPRLLIIAQCRFHY